MNESMCRVQRGSFVYYTCRRIPVRHAFTTKFGGVSTGACESLNLGFNRGHHANLWNVLIHCEDDMWLDTGRDNRSH